MSNRAPLQWTAIVEGEQNNKILRDGKERERERESTPREGTWHFAS